VAGVFVVLVRLSLGTCRVLGRVGLREKLKAFRHFVWHHLDALAVILVGFGVVGLQVFGSPKKELIDAAILALLATTAIVLLRDRIGRDDLADLRQLAGDAISDRPYQVVWQKNEWDIGSRQHATMRMTQQIRFTRNDVSTLAHWNKGDGRIECYSAKWRRSEDSPWVSAKKIHSFGIHSGEKVIYSLDEEHSRGDMLDWRVERDAVGRFPEEHEAVALEAKAKSDHSRVMRVFWPADAAPSHVALKLKGQPARPLSTRRKGGRPFVEEKIAHLGIGEVVEITWTW
jgi:hypothetical protein